MLTQLKWTLLAAVFPLSAVAANTLTKVPGAGNEILADLGTYYAVPSVGGRKEAAPRMLVNSEGVRTIVLFGKYSSPNFKDESVTLVSKQNPENDQIYVSCSPGTVPGTPWKTKSEVGFDWYYISALKQEGTQSYVKLDGLNVICRAPNDGDPTQSHLIKDLMGDPEVIGLKAYSGVLENTMGELAAAVSSSSSRSNRGSSKSTGEWSNYSCTGDSPMRTQIIYATSSAQAQKSFCSFDTICGRSYTTCVRQ